MKKIIILIMWFLASYNAFSQGIISGSGVCLTNSNPNAITSLNYVNNCNCTFVYDTVGNKRYYYESSLSIGSRWVESVRRGEYWSLLGNSGTNSSTNFIGTTDNQPLVFRTNNIEAARISTNGNVGIGTTTPTYKLDITGTTNNVAMRVNSGGVNIGDGNGFLGFHFSNMLPNQQYFSGLALNNSVGTFDIKSAGRLNMFFNSDASYPFRIYSQTWNTGTVSYDYTERLKIDGQTGLVTIGKISIQDGTQGAGKVFVSDATGLGSWQTVPYVAKQFVKTNVGNITADVTTGCEETGQGYTNLVSSDFANIATAGRKIEVHINGVKHYYKATPTSTSGLTWSYSAGVITPKNGINDVNISTIEVKINP